MAFRPVSPTTVREFFAAKGGTVEGVTVASTGRISDAAAKVYNRANPGRPYKPAQYEGKVIKVTAKPEKGRSVTKGIVESTVREQCRALGVPVGERGALPKAIREAAVLGTLATLAKG